MIPILIKSAHASVFKASKAHRKAQRASHVWDSRLYRARRRGALRFGLLSAAQPGAGTRRLGLALVGLDLPDQAVEVREADVREQHEQLEGDVALEAVAVRRDRARARARQERAEHAAEEVQEQGAGDGEEAHSREGR